MQWLPAIWKLLTVTLTVPKTRCLKNIWSQIVLYTVSSDHGHLPSVILKYFLKQNKNIKEIMDLKIPVYQSKSHSVISEQNPF